MSRRTILVVEDEDMIRSMVVEAIRACGYEVMERSDGSSAKELLESKAEIELLVSDVILPGVNGFRLAEIALTRRRPPKVLLMTGYTSSPIPSRLSEAGITIMHKPFKIDDLLTTVLSLLPSRPASDNE
jgi:DNA-binding response OmpR family regulator